VGSNNQLGISTRLHLLKRAHSQLILNRVIHREKPDARMSKIVNAQLVNLLI
jgi:hypothetical protein